jgi:hypothetical protein
MLLLKNWHMLRRKKLHVAAQEVTYVAAQEVTCCSAKSDIIYYGARSDNFNFGFRPRDVSSLTSYTWEQIYAEFKTVCLTSL